MEIINVGHTNLQSRWNYRGSKTADLSPTSSCELWTNTLNISYDRMKATQKKNHHISFLENPISAARVNSHNSHYM